MSYPAPRFPEPPSTWLPTFMREYTRVLVNWILQLTAETSEEAGETAVRTITASGLIGVNDGVVFVDNTAGDVTATLPDMATVKGRQFTVKRITAGAHACTVNATAGLIDGGASASLAAQWEAYTFKSNGLAYYIVGAV